MHTALKLVLLPLLIASLPVANAQTSLDIGGDRFLSGEAPVHDVDGIDDLFMAGNHVRSESAISGSANMAGRKVVIEGAVGGDVYVAAMDVLLAGAIEGDATVAGYDVEVGEVGGDLRVTAQTVSISGPVGGYALITGERVEFGSALQGDVSVTARDVEFAEGAQIEGRLTVYEDRLGETTIPESVVPEDRIERRLTAEATAADADLEVWDRRHPLMQFLTRVALVALLATLIATLTPKISAKLRSGVLGRPLSTLLLGFLALSAAIGAAIVLAITGVGLILVPVPLLVAFVGALAGYLVGVYVFGTGLLHLARRPEQDSAGARALAACIGALAATIVSLIPVFGWIGTLTIALAGLGALAVWLFRPKFFAAV